MRVFLIDDDQDVLEAMVLMLEAFGHEVASTSESETAISSIEKHLPDCVITDLFMPIVDGFSLIEMLRNSPKLAHLKVIAISSKEDQHVAAEALNAGANKFLGKSFALYSLSDTIDEVCGVPTHA